MNTSDTSSKKPFIDQLFAAGAHFALPKARRHPSTKKLIFGSKNGIEIFDLEKTAPQIEKALAYVKALGADKKTVLFVGGKSEVRSITKTAAEALNLPYVAGRWIGGTLTNFKEVRGRVETMLSLQAQREKGELAKYTKKERLLIDRQIDNLEFYFSGIVALKELPKALIVVDPRAEIIAVTEAKRMGIPVVAIANSDCNIDGLTEVIPANDSSVASVRYLLAQIVAAYQGK